MSERKSEYQVRKEKLEQLRARGVNPYAAQYDKTHGIQHIINTVGESLRDVEQAIADPQIQVSIA